MKQQLWLGVVLLGMCTGAVAQAPQSAATTTFTSRSEAVLVPVAVRDKSGQVASGLKQEEFRLFVDGKPVSIASFEEVKSGAAPALLPIKRGVFTNRIANEDQPQRLTVLLLDYLNTPFLNQEEERQEIAKFVQHQLKPDEPVALLALTRGGLRMLQTFTTNSGDLTVAVRRSRGEMSRSEANGLHWVGPMPQDLGGSFILRDRIRLTLDELEQLGNALAGVPGRKVVVWTTGGFPYMTYERHSLTHQDTRFLDDYEHVWHTLNQANVSLYTVDAKGLVNTLFEERFSAQRSRMPLNARNPLRYDIFREEQDTLHKFAEETGGVACMNRNQYASCIDEAQREAVDYYLLSFRVAPEMRSKDWHKIQVKLDGKYDVRARQGFSVQPAKAPDMKDEIKVMSKALRSPLEYTGLKLSFQWVDVKPIPAGTALPPAPEKSPAAKYPPVAIAKFHMSLAPRSVEINTADQNRLELTLMAVAIDTNNEFVCELAKSIDAHLNETELRLSDTNGTEVDNEVALPAGRLRVRFAVRDRITGRIGTIEAPIMVPAPQAAAAGK